MNGHLLMDTHVWVWTFFEPKRLSRLADSEVVGSDTLHISAISIYEVVQKVRLGKWPDLAVTPAQLVERSIEQGIELLPVTAPMAASAGELDWPHRDPFDRLIAATALDRGLSLVSRDPAFSALPGLRVIW